jgi:hypothetical protein
LGDNPCRDESRNKDGLPEREKEDAFDAKEFRDGPIRDNNLDQRGR